LSTSGTFPVSSDPWTRAEGTLPVDRSFPQTGNLLFQGPVEVPSQVSHDHKRLLPFPLRHGFGISLHDRPFFFPPTNFHFPTSLPASTTQVASPRSRTALFQGQAAPLRQGLGLTSPPPRLFFLISFTGPSTARAPRRPGLPPVCFHFFPSRQSCCVFSLYRKVFPVNPVVLFCRTTKDAAFLCFPFGFLLLFLHPAFEDFFFFFFLDVFFFFFGHRPLSFPFFPFRAPFFSFPLPPSVDFFFPITVKSFFLAAAVVL